MLLQMTIADIANISSLNFMLGIDKEKFPLLGAWFDNMRTYPFYVNGNLPGLRKLRDDVQERAAFEIGMCE